MRLNTQLRIRVLKDLDSRWPRIFAEVTVPESLETMQAKAERPLQLPCLATWSQGDVVTAGWIALCLVATL